MEPFDHDFFKDTKVVRSMSYTGLVWQISNWKVFSTNARILRGFAGSIILKFE